MKKNYQIFLRLSLSLGIAFSISVLPLQASLTQRIINTIKTKNQAALCKQGGIFRERGGINCKDEKIAMLSVTACNTPDFKESGCFINARDMLKITGLAAASTNIKAMIQSKDSVIYPIVCGADINKLDGLLKTYAQYNCKNTATPARPTLAAPVMTAPERQRIKSLLQKDMKVVENFKRRISADLSTKKGNIKIGSKREKTLLLNKANEIENHQQELIASLDNINTPAPNKLINILESLESQLENASTDQEFSKLLDEFSAEIRKLK